MKILHVIRELEDPRAFETALAHAAEHEVTLVLVQDAVLSRTAWDGQVYACREDLDARGPNPGVKELDYRELIGMIFGHDRVIMW